MPIHEWIGSRAIETIARTAYDLTALGARIGEGAPPSKWLPERRQSVRVDLDAAFFHLYGLGRDDVDYIMDTFPIVRRKDEAAHGEYRTKRLILERYDAMAEAEANGSEYETVLAPPPADPSIAHDPATRPTWADWYLGLGNVDR